jgi:hypothetical protein
LVAFVLISGKNFQGALFGKPAKDQRTKKDRASESTKAAAVAAENQAAKEAPAF